MDVYLRLLTYVKPVRGMFLLSVLGIVIFSAAQPLLPELMKHIVNAIQDKDVAARWTLPWMAVGVFALQGLGTFISGYSMAHVSGTIVRNLQKELFNHYTTLPAAYFDATPSGQNVARITGSVGMVTAAITKALVVVLREGLSVVFLVGYIFYSNWELSLTFLVIAPFIAFMVRYAGGRFHKVSHKMQNIAGDTLQVINEMMTGYRVMRSFGGEKYEKDRFAETCDKSFKLQMQMQKVASINAPVLQLIVAIAIAIIVFLILQPSVLEHASAGDLIAYITAVALLPKPVKQLSEINGDIQKGIAGAQRVFEVLDTPTEVDSGTVNCVRAAGDLRVHGLSYRYSAEAEPVLIEIDFEAAAGQTVALVGHSGSGKSTLVSLIPRFYEYEAGEILLDGTPIKNYKLTDLRAQIALVTQHVVLFKDSVANNIAYGSLASRSRSEIIAAAQAANAMEFIDKLPLGLDTQIGENGLQLSGGQRQRLAIARALLKDAPILILDEATSALDNESEAKIQQALQRVMNNRTTLVIAHRLSTIEQADMILVMDKGRIVERGTHARLLEKNGFYARLYRSGFDEAG